MKKINKLLICVLCSVFCLLIFSSCATTPKQGDMLAFVDGEPVTKEDIEYALQISHRREDLSAAKTLDISRYIQQAIDNRLIIHEALRMGMDEFPEVQQKVQAFILRESVVRLYNEEIVEKVSVTEEDIINYYKENYERSALDLIEVETEEEAGEILAKLKSGEDFGEFSRKYPANSAKKEGQEGFIFTRKSMSPAIQEAVYSLKPGEFSDVIKARNKYYIIKLISRQEAPDEELDSVRGNIERALRKQKIKERSDEYLAQLHEEADVKINKEILSSITADATDEEREQWLKDERPLIEVGNEALSVGDFAAMLPPRYGDKAKENTLKNWLDRKLVDREALSRHYERRTDLKDKIARYENQVVKNTFIKKIIVPEITVTDKDVEDYYLSHPEEFAKPPRYRIQQITLKSREEAEDVLNSLKAGANFSWLAKRRSTDPAAARGGVAGWKTREQLPGSLVEIIDTLKPGDISPILEVDNVYRIIRLMEKIKKGVKEFDEVKLFAGRAAYKEKYRATYNEYINKLKEDAVIEINDQALRSFEEIFKK
ncbi:MAG TPA: peptidyl-prolyl cis-trans isomerase [Nitrospirae bacterium]|nr:foldase protein PrsA 2 precursor [bacterium BMS3Abin06]HDH13593.1 peptidyl-prolyl cis-trans isomerase [Nitrospirota bacterium]HDZ01173.1 peptidyl-prolyl cis-trans isomerase [Nitrospirota bacterium]